MKSILINLFILITLNILSQTDTIKKKSIINYSNTASGIYVNNNDIKELNLNFNGYNSFVKGNKSLNNNSTYSFRYNTKIHNNELLVKTNIGYNNFFISHIFNHSLLRNIKYDNYLGIGYNHKWKNISLSYAFMYENIIDNELLVKNLYRHSVRFKFKYEHNLFSIIAEYYYQPNMIELEDVVIYGSTKINLFKKNKLSFSIVDNINYKNTSNIKLIHSIGIGISYNLKIIR